MAKIGFFIQSSNQELFVNNTNVLKEYYHKVISENGYDIELYSFVGKTDLPEGICEDGDVIYCKCSDHYPYIKYELLFSYICNYKKYDYILITNNTTLTNLQFLYNVIDTVNLSYYYHVNTITNFMNYPNGNVKLMSWSVFQHICNLYACAYYSILPVYDFFAGYGVSLEAEENTNRWLGVPEDMIIGACLFKADIKCFKINEYCSLFEYLDAPVKKEVDWDNTLFLTLKMSAPYDYRLKHETECIKDIISKL